ncbi:MAG: LNG1/LNG2 family protein [Humibacillus sp.]|nr:LNG1/LNG2 family protein [Humibacillus sp.]MDN5780383.1 LNG1/LNG2 family protein [Humibacillus sp.]
MAPQLENQSSGSKGTYGPPPDLFVRSPWAAAGLGAQVLHLFLRAQWRYAGWTTKLITALVAPFAYLVWLVLFTLAYVVMGALPNVMVFRETLTRDGRQVFASGLLRRRGSSTNWGVSSLFINPQGKGTIKAIGKESRLLRWADEQQVVLHCQAVNERVVDTYALIGFVRDAPGSTRMTRAPDTCRGDRLAVEAAGGQPDATLPAPPPRPARSGR